MPEKKIVYQNANGVRRTLIADDERPGFVVHTQQDIAEILSGVKRDREIYAAANDNRSPIRPVARIPVEIFEKMILEGWGPDDEAKWLNSPEAEPFRIWKGRV
jgi:hypothetical protein